MRRRASVLADSCLRSSGRLAQGQKGRAARTNSCGRTDHCAFPPLNSECRIGPNAIAFWFLPAASSLCSSMSFRLIGPTLAISLTLFGCANSRTEPSSDARIWAAQLQRQQEVVRNQGRIGHIGYEGPSSR